MQNKILSLEGKKDAGVLCPFSCLTWGIRGQQLNPSQKLSLKGWNECVPEEPGLLQILNSGQQREVFGTCFGLNITGT